MSNVKTNHYIGTNIRSHLISKGVDVPNDTKFYNLTPLERVLKIKNNLDMIKKTESLSDVSLLVEEIYNIIGNTDTNFSTNSIKNIVNNVFDSKQFAMDFYNKSKGNSYKNFPNVTTHIKSDESDDQYSYKLNVGLEFEDVRSFFTWGLQNVTVELVLHAKHYISYQDVCSILHFYTLRPFHKEKFVKQVKETLFYLYDVKIDLFTCEVE